MTKSPCEFLKKRFFTSKEDIFFSSIDGKNYTYSDLLFYANCIAKRWRKDGLNPGDCIAIILENSFAIPCFFLACVLGGFVACPIVKKLPETTIQGMLSRINPALIIREQIEFDLLSEKNIDQDLFRSISSEQVFLSIFTSGTTGLPKIIRHKLGSIIGSAMAFSKLSCIDKRTRLYHILPMCYMAGIVNAMFVPLMGGATIVEGPEFSPAAAMDFWSRPLGLDVNFLSIIPSIAASLCTFTRDKNVISEIQKKIIQIQCTSAPINIALRKRFFEKFGIPLQDCYGITELGGPLALQTKEDATSDKEGGTPIRGIEVDIREEGALWIRSPFKMIGYFEDGKMTSYPFKNEFMDTGDLASYKNGKIRITGRTKDIIIRGGINISPVQLENKISLMPGVCDVAVVGNAHDFWGEELVFCIIPIEDFLNNEKDFRKIVIGWSKKNLAPSEQPDRIELLDSFPRSFSGKVDKKELRKRFVKL